MSTLTPRIDKIDKNYLINGAFDFFQRNTGSVTIGGGFSYQTADRWAIGYNAGGGITSQTSARSATVPNGSVKYSIKLSANAPTSAGNMLIRQRIEAANARELSGQIVNLSVWVRSESASQVRLDVSTPTVEDNFTSTTLVSNTFKTVTVGTSWQLVTFEDITIPAAANMGLQITLSVENFTITGLIKDHYMSQVMLNVGDKVADFARAGVSIAGELQLCQRYYEYNPNQIAIYLAGSGTGYTGISYPYKVTKRATPTLVVTDTPGNVNKITVITNNTGGQNPNQNVLVHVNGIDTHRLLFVDNSTSFGILYNFTADAEL